MPDRTPQFKSAIAIFDAVITICSNQWFTGHAFRRLSTRAHANRIAAQAKLNSAVRGMDDEAVDFMNQIFGKDI